jgi:hypothetical protein
VYGTRQGISAADTDRYARIRGVQQIKDKVRFWGQLTRSDYRP